MNRLTQAALAGLVVLAGVGMYMTPGWLARRAEAREVERVLAAADTIAVEFEACVVEGAAPPDYGHAITERLLLDRGYPARILACAATREAALATLLDSVEIHPKPDSIVELRQWREERRLFSNPSRSAICFALERQRLRRAELLELLGQSDAAPPAMTCPQLEDYEVWSVKPLALPENSADVLWKAEHLHGDVLFAKHQGTSQQPGRIAAITLDGITSVELPEHIDDALLRFGPKGPVAVARPDDARYAAGSKPYRIERWSEGFEPRPAPRGMGTPEELWLTPERWFLASIDDPRKPTELTVHISDDEGERFRSLTPPTLPALPRPRRFRLMGHAEGSELLMLAARATAGADDFEPTFQALPAELQLAVVRIDAAGQISSSALAVEHSPTSRWQVELQACSTGGGAIAVIDGEAVVVVEGLEARLVHRFGAGEELDATGLALACHGRQALLLARRRAEPEPIESVTRIKSSGGPLHRFVCDADGCDAGELVTDWALHWDLRPTATGVRALVQLHVAPVATVHLIDEPPGGPLEQRIELNSYFAPIRGVAWDGLTFAPALDRGRWGWF